MRNYSNYDNRPLSPFRTSNRPLSPLRRSPYTNQAPLSPLRSRKMSRTPTKVYSNTQGFFRSPRKPFTNEREYGKNGREQQKNYMQETIKKGVGLFQNLVSQKKFNSERKSENLFGNGKIKHKSTLQCKQSDHSNVAVRKFEYSQQKVFPNNPISKFSFTSILQNVQEIESIRQGHPRSEVQFEQNLSTFERQNKAKTSIRQHENYYQYTQISDVSSFGTSNLEKFTKQSQNRNTKEDGNPQIKENQLKQKQDNSNAKKELFKNIIKSKKQVQSMQISESDDFGDVHSLIKKVSEGLNTQKDHCESQEQVRMSIEQESFNMKPYL